MRTVDHPRRGFWFCLVGALASVIVPGLGHLAIRARFRRAVVVATVLAAVATIALLLVLVPVRSRSDLADIIADRTVFVGLAVGLAVLAITRLWSALDAAWQARPENDSFQAGALFAAVLVAIIGVAPLAASANYVWQTDRVVERVFSDHDATTANPGTLAATTSTTSAMTTTAAAVSTTAAPTTAAPTTAAASTTAAPTAATTTTSPPFPGTDRVNVLLLGGDAGPGRWSLRTDSMIVVSIDPITGDSAMISVPRNLRRLPFPEGTALNEKYPDGFSDIANAVYPYVNGHRELMGGIEDAGSQAIKLGIAQLLGIPINYYILVDMAGFVDVVDALGGIEVDVTKRVPSAKNPSNAKHPVPRWFEIGPQHMDGTLALAYARTREADSDYWRMARQRCVLAGIAAAATPRTLATGLTDLVSAFGDAVRTDIPRERLGELAQVVDRYSQAGGLAAVRTLHLAPPLVNPAKWDAADVRALVANVLTPGAPVGGTPAPVLAEACA